jgi:hypothetical protein
MNMSHTFQLYSNTPSRFCSRGGAQRGKPTRRLYCYYAPDMTITFPLCSHFHRPCSRPTPRPCRWTSNRLAAALPRSSALSSNPSYSAAGRIPQRRNLKRGCGTVTRIDLPVLPFIAGELYRLSGPISPTHYFVLRIRGVDQIHLSTGHSSSQPQPTSRSPEDIIKPSPPPLLHSSPVPSFVFSPPPAACHSPHL